MEGAGTEGLEGIKFEQYCQWQKDILKRTGKRLTTNRRGDIQQSSSMPISSSASPGHGVLKVHQLGRQHRGSCLWTQPGMEETLRDTSPGVPTTNQRGTHPKRLVVTKVLVGGRTFAVLHHPGANRSRSCWISIYQKLDSAI